jgi:hypothetical protein
MGLTFGVTLVLRIVMFAIALFVITATTSEVDASCSQIFEVAVARVRSAIAGQSSVDPARYEESCREYFNQFFEAVKARQATSICEDGIDRQRALEIFDAEIDAYNNLIASQCRSP